MKTFEAFSDFFRAFSPLLPAVLRRPRLLHAWIPAGVAGCGIARAPDRGRLTPLWYCGQRADDAPHKWAFQQSAADAFNQIVCELALEGFPSDPVTAEDISFGRLLDGHAAVIQGKLSSAP